MIEHAQREPHTAAATLAFFGVGQVFHNLGGSETFEQLNILLSTLSFLVSITVGTITIVRTVKKWKDQP
jgi:hypothetical protein